MKECLSKAEEALQAAELCCEQGLYDSCVSRCYYAMFWVAIAGLEHIGYASQEWSHSGLMNVFGREIVKKRNLVARKIAAHFRNGYHLRLSADYGRDLTGAKRARRALGHAQVFVARLEEVIL